MAAIKKAQTGKRVDPKKYLEESRKRVETVTDSARKAETRKGINTYDDYLKSKVKEKSKKRFLLPRKLTYGFNSLFTKEKRGRMSYNNI